MALAPGTRLGPYEVTAQIGEGGTGGSVSGHRRKNRAKSETTGELSLTTKESI